MRTASFIRTAGTACIMAAAVWACEDMPETVLASAQGESLTVSVTSGAATRAAGPITGTRLPGGSLIGVAMEEDGKDTYNGHAYRNMAYTASGEGAAQTWAASEDIRLSSVVGKAYAYYPYDSEVEDISAIPVTTAAGMDCMYATPVAGLSAVNPEATLHMNHAMALIRLRIRKDGYSDTGKVTSVSLRADGIAASGILDARAGQWKGDAFGGTGESQQFATDITLTQQYAPVSLLVVPTGRTGILTITLTADGWEYTATTAATAVTGNSIYEVTLTLRDYCIETTAFTVKDWEIESDTSGASSSPRERPQGEIDAKEIDNWTQQSDDSGTEPNHREEGDQQAIGIEDWTQQD